MDAFTRFIMQCKGDLEQIARFSRREHSLEDVLQQAWLEARELADELGSAPDHLDPAFQQHVLKRLRRRLLDSDRKFRHATRLDHGFDGDGAHPLTWRLVSDEGRDPLSDLLEAECATPAPDEDQLPLSLALAWAVLLRKHDQHMRTVAARLLISVSHAYHCCARARWLAAHQHAMPLEPAPRMAEPRLGPWRRRRALRIPRQLAFDFDEELNLVESS